jgi:hypothetical protein
MVFSNVALLAAAASLLAPAYGQTWTKCNPLERSDCPPDPALGGSTDADFTSGSSSDFTAQSNPTFGPDGAELTVATTGQAPTLLSKWYVMFGRVDITMKIAPGNGIVSSFVMQSDDLDEIDIEWIGSQPTQVQTNFFGKGFEGSFNRGANFDVPDSQAEFHTYSIDWNADRLEWLIDGTVLRTLKPNDFPGQYPQSPMQIKFGSWSAGDPKTNPPGTVQWADGPTDYSAGPFTMTVQKISVQDYSTGSQYTYGDQTGNWQSIEAEDGEVNAHGTGSDNPAPTSSSTLKSTPTSTSSKAPEPTSTLVTKTSEPATDAPSTTDGPTVSPSAPAAPGETTTTPAGGYTPYQTGGYTPTKSTGTPSGSPSPVPGENAASGTQVAWGLSMMAAFVAVVAM